MTGVSSQRSSKFCDEGADGGEEEVGADAGLQRKPGTGDC